MRKHTYIGMLAAMVLLSACNEQPEITILNKGELALTARTESSTKTVVTDETFVYWEPGDEIVVFAGDERSQFTTDLEAPAAMAVFKGTFSKDLAVSDLWALYPYNADATFDGEHVTTTIPATQTARAGSFAKGMNISVAHSSGTDLQFYNVGGGLRFSVTEEGVKKVIFEGLDGETIAGTVTIGFEEGLPKVTGVTSGSQFITLLPPDGETFRTNTWYFIVAIPGALEKGYKLRFYKTDDYARRVSENAVTIARSVFGSVAGADGGIEYESTTLFYPETQEEWEETERRTQEIGPQVKNIVSTLDLSDYEKEKEALMNIEGVIDAYIDQASGSVSVMQKDSVWLYYFTGFYENSPAKFVNGLTTKASVYDFSLRTKSAQSDNSINADKKALLLAPYFGEQSEVIKDLLMDAGFKEENIIIKKDKEADILYFKGDYLMNFKYIYIDTHGGTGYWTSIDDDPAASNWVFPRTALLSGTKFTAAKALTLVSSNKLSKKQVAIGYHENIISPLSPDPVPDYRFCMIPNFLTDADFSMNKPYIELNACSSDAINHSRTGSMVNAFLSKSAGAVCGYSASINSFVCSLYSLFVLKLMSVGFSSQKASAFLKESEYFEALCDSERNRLEYVVLPNDNSKSEEEKKEILLATDHKLYQYYPSLAPEFYLVNPFPAIITPPTINEDNTISFNWNCDLKSFSQDFSFDYYHMASPTLYSRVMNGEVEYDLFVDSLLVKTTSGSDDSAKQVTVEVTAGGDHSWYVVGKLILDGNVEATYKSEVGHFTVEQTASAAEISVSPSSFLLEQREIGVVSERTLTITNSGSGPLQISSVTCTERVSTDFDSWTETSIPAGESRTLTVKYTRPSAGYYRGSITINSNASNNFAQTVTISGTTLEITTPDAVDIGLSVKWGSRNLGASKPEDRGLFYAWGETETKDCYGANTYKWYNGTNLYDAGTILKYNAMEGTSSYDGKSVLDAEDDVAHVKLGGNWRMPTQKEVQELKATRNDSNYTWEWIDKKGWKVTYIPNGNSIFLPLSGYRTGWPDSSGFPSGTDYGYFWTSSIRADYPFEAWFAMFRSSYFQIDTGGAMYGRDKGLPIRPVCK